MLLTTSPLILPPEPIGAGRRYGCPLCAYLERGDVLVVVKVGPDGTDQVVAITPSWVAPTHSDQVPELVSGRDRLWYRVAHGHAFAVAPGTDLSPDSDHQPYPRPAEIPERLSELLEYYRPQRYAHHRQLAPLYWSLVVAGGPRRLITRYQTRARALSADDELRAFYGQLVVANALSLFAKWEFLGHDFELRWAKSVEVKYQLFRSNLMANPTLPYSWPIGAELTVNPPLSVYQLGGGHGQYLAVVTERLEGQSVAALFPTLPGDQLYRVGLEGLALLHEAHYGPLVHHWMHLDPHLDNFLLGTELASGRARRLVHLTNVDLVLTEPLWLIDYNSAYFPDFPSEFVAADFAYANEQEGWWKRYTTINPAWDAIYFLRSYWWLIAERRPELLQRPEFQRFLLTTLAAIPEQLLLFAGRLNPLEPSDEVQQWFYNLLGRSTTEVQSMVVEQARRQVLDHAGDGSDSGPSPSTWLRAWFGHYRGVSFIGQRRLSVGNGTIGDLLEELLSSD